MDLPFNPFKAALRRSAALQGIEQGQGQARPGHRRLSLGVELGGLQTLVALGQALNLG